MFNIELFWHLTECEQNLYLLCFWQTVLTLLFWTNSGSNTPSLYAHLPPISQTIQVREKRNVEHGWWGKDELLHMDTRVLADQQKLTFTLSVQMLNTIWKICKECWLIGTNSERDSGESMLSAWWEGKLKKRSF